VVKTSSLRESGVCEKNPLLLLFQTESNGVSREQRRKMSQ